MATKYAYYGKPYCWSPMYPDTEDYQTPPPVTDREWSDHGNHEGALEVGWAKLGATVYNWGNYNFFVGQSRGDTFLPKNRVAGTGAESFVEIFKFEADEYPVSIEFTDKKDRSFTPKFDNRYSNTSTTANVYLCDADAPQNRVKLATITLAASSSNAWKGVHTINYANAAEREGVTGKHISIQLEQTAGTNGAFIFRQRAEVRFITSNVARHLILDNGTGGHIQLPTTTVNDQVVNIDSAVRGQTVVLTPVPDRGYELVSITATAGTLIQQNDGTYLFTMATPAVDTTITTRWKKTDYPIRKVASIENAGTIEAPETAKYGASVTVAQTPASNQFRFKYWTLAYDSIPADDIVAANAENDIDVDNLLIQKAAAMTAAQQQEEGTPQREAADAKVEDIEAEIAVLSSTERIAKTSSQSGGQVTFTMNSSPLTLIANYLKHGIRWFSPSLRVRQEDELITATMTGVAVDNFGEAVTYCLYKNGRYVSTFSNGTAMYILKPNEVQKELEFSLVAVSSIASVGDVDSLNTKSVHKTVKYHNGNGFVECVPYYHNGEEWVEVEPHYYDGTEWVLCSMT